MRSSENNIAICHNPALQAVCIYYQEANIAPTRYRAKSEASISNIYKVQTLQGRRQDSSCSVRIVIVARSYYKIELGSSLLSVFYRLGSPVLSLPFVLVD